MPLQCGCFAGYHCCYHGGAASIAKIDTATKKPPREQILSEVSLYLMQFICMCATIRAAYIVLQISFPWAFCHI